MKKNPTKLIKIAGISYPLVGVYEPRAMVGATDIAMRKYLPQNTFAFTVTKPMFEQLCGFDGNSFLHQSFWNDLKQSSEQPNESII